MFFNKTQVLIHSSTSMVSSLTLDRKLGVEMWHPSKREKELEKRNVGKHGRNQTNNTGRAQYSDQESGGDLGHL